MPGPIPGLRSQNPFVFIPDYDKDEDVALAGQIGFRPASSIQANNVYINGIALAYVVNPGPGVSPITVQGNAAPANIPRTVPPARGVDPEQAFVAALSSCHMLWFLHLACQRKFVVERYVDGAVGVLDKDWVSKVTLRPVVAFSGRAPSPSPHPVSTATRSTVEPTITPRYPRARAPRCSRRSRARC